MPELAASAKTAVRLLQESNKSLAPIEIIEGDMFETDWHNADFVYVTNLCFPAEMNTRLTVELGKLRSGVKVITIKALAETDKLVVLERLMVRMSWDRHELFIYQRT